MAPGCTPQGAFANAGFAMLAAAVFGTVDKDARYDRTGAPAPLLGVATPVDLTDNATPDVTDVVLLPVAVNFSALDALMMRASVDGEAPEVTLPPVGDCMPVVAPVGLAGIRR